FKKVKKNLKQKYFFCILPQDKGYRGFPVKGEANNLKQRSCDEICCTFLLYLEDKNILCID
ncbi:MAG TPA: hypothetical protein PLX16_04020, partial [Exilispira sp.]|nr:hypothetical protein [Exilispira sp.]